MASPLNLTKGSVPKLLLLFSLPLVLTNFLQTIHLMLDLLLLGRALGADAIGAVAVGGQSILLLSTFSIGLSAGGQILIAQKRGAKEEEQETNIEKATLTLSLLAGIFFSLFAYFAAGVILNLLQTPPEAFDKAKEYMQVLSLGLLATFLYQGVAGVLRGRGEARLPLLCMAIATGIHLLLGLLFVFVFSWGMTGAAISGIIGQSIATVLGLFFLWKKGKKPSPKSKTILPNPGTCLQIVKLGLPFGLQMGLLQLANVFVIRLIAPFGISAVSALGVSARVTNMLTLPMMAIGNAASSMIGQNLGAKEISRAKAVIGFTKLYTLSFIGVTTVVTLLFPAPLLQLFTDDPQVISIGSVYLRILSASYLAHALHSIFNAPLLASGKTSYSLYAAGAEGLLGRILLTWVFSNTWGLTGIFIAQAISSYLGSFLLWFYYRKHNLETALPPSQ